MGGKKGDGDSATLAQVAAIARELVEDGDGGALSLDELVVVQGADR
jgi:hypothetical protein